MAFVTTDDVVPYTSTPLPLCYCYDVTAAAERAAFPLPGGGRSGDLPRRAPHTGTMTLLTVTPLTMTPLTMTPHAMTLLAMPLLAMTLLAMTLLTMTLLTRDLLLRALGYHNWPMAYLAQHYETRLDPRGAVAFPSHAELPRGTVVRVT